MTKTSRRCPSPDSRRSFKPSDPGTRPFFFWDVPILIFIFLIIFFDIFFDHIIFSRTSCGISEYLRVSKCRIPYGTGFETRYWRRRSGNSLQVAGCSFLAELFLFFFWPVFFQFSSPNWDDGNDQVTNHTWSLPGRWWLGLQGGICERLLEPTRDRQEPSPGAHELREQAVSWLRCGKTEKELMPAEKEL